MAIRKNTNPQQMDLQPEMRDLLMRNGMQAHVVSNGSGYQLVVQGHDSPLLTYNITEKQMLALTDWGTNHANKLAYNTFTSIVGNDFYMPKTSSMHAMPTDCGYGAARLSCWYRRVWTDGAHRNATTLLRLDTTQSGRISSSQSWRTTFLS